MQDSIKILEDRIVEENIEVIIGIKIIAEKEIGADLEKDHFQGRIIIMMEGMIEAKVIVDQGQDQEQAQIEIESSVISVENMIILQKIVLHPNKREI